MLRSLCCCLIWPTWPGNPIPLMALMAPKLPIDVKRHRLPKVTDLSEAAEEACQHVLESPIPTPLPANLLLPTVNCPSSFHYFLTGQDKKRNPCLVLI
ncbi:uncharacterized protein EI90DRAFT_3071137 [Cantharellus anzutake]|uniref:uncharacterized protein n=1 Tax=Cantharellus anzutake TaxID=1750568 RepID=UPI001908DE3A|nr:uncharacterized protein EI90DRAFT_3071137 [Cantharellus anzutake]KAF8326014.1 hypothetical protein EI90DRAFT_3071137 [Cantharellus anzutake]